MPSWAGVLGLAVWILTLLLLVGGPAPWRANRWAWFWFFWFAPPFGQLAYLLVGGPTGLLPPRADAPRLRGGWGFILALVTGTVLGGTLAGTALVLGA